MAGAHSASLVATNDDLSNDDVRHCTCICGARFAELEATTEPNQTSFPSHSLVQAPLWFVSGSIITLVLYGSGRNCSTVVVIGSIVAAVVASMIVVANFYRWRRSILFSVVPMVLNYYYRLFLIYHQLSHSMMMMTPTTIVKVDARPLLYHSSTYLYPSPSIYPAIYLFI